MRQHIKKSLPVFAASGVAVLWAWLAGEYLPPTATYLEWLRLALWWAGWFGIVVAVLAVGVDCALDRYGARNGDDRE